MNKRKTRRKKKLKKIIEHLKRRKPPQKYETKNVTNRQQKSTP